jgi:hypothetical protein
VAEAFTAAGFGPPSVFSVEVAGAAERIA